MKFYSEVLNKLFDSEKELRSEELKKKMEDEKRAKEKEDYNRRYEEAYNDVRKKLNDAEKSVSNFIDNFGSKPDGDLYGLFDVINLLL